MWEHLLATWRGAAPGCSVDMFDTTGASQRQRVLALQANLKLYEHRGELVSQWEYIDMARIACQLYIPHPPRRLPVGNYGKSARAAMQLEFLAAMAAGRSFIQASADLEADRRTVYSWMETDEAFRWAVQKLRGRD